MLSAVDTIRLFLDAGIDQPYGDKRVVAVPLALVSFASMARIEVLAASGRRARASHGPRNRMPTAKDRAGTNVRDG